MEPVDQFDICIYSWFYKLAQLAGIDLFAEKFTPNALTYTTISSLWILLVSCTWTIYTYEFDEKVICAAMLAFNFQGVVKMHSILSNTKTLTDIAEFCLKIYKANTTPSPNKTLLARSVKVTTLIFKYGMILLVTTATLVLVKPCISFIAFGERIPELEPILPTHFPLINEDEIIGYTILAVYHTFIVFVFVIGTAGCDLFLMTLVVHGYTMSCIFRNAVVEFNDLIGNHERNASKEELRMYLKNLILMHNDFIKYTRILKTVYNEMCLIQITMANTAMIVLIYVILLMDWFPAYFLMATAFFQVFEYSLMGTIVELSNDNIYNMICNISLTDLPMVEQKKIILMTLIAQHPHNLTIGGFKSLNVETFIISMKNTYSVGMLLVNTQM